MTAPEDWEHHLVRVTVTATYTRPGEDVDAEDAGDDAGDGPYRDDGVPPPIAREGLVDVDFEGDYITWTWHGEPTPVDGQRPVSQSIPGQGALDLDTGDGAR